MLVSQQPNYPEEMQNLEGRVQEGNADAEQLQIFLARCQTLQQPRVTGGRQMLRGRSERAALSLLSDGDDIMLALHRPAAKLA